MDKKEKLLEDIRQRLSDFRYEHSVEVAAAARALAVKYGYDPEKAYITGLAHDVLKELSAQEYIDFFAESGIILTRVERSAPKLWHAMAGARYLQDEYGFDSDICDAVRYHTTGREEMSLLEKIIFVADFISADRSYNGVEDMRKRAQLSLEKAMEEGLRFTIEELSRENRPIHPDTVACYNEILLTVKDEKK